MVVGLKKKRERKSNPYDNQSIIVGRKYIKRKIRYACLMKSYMHKENNQKKNRENVMRVLRN